MRTRRVAIRWLLAKGDSRPEGGLCMRVTQTVSSPALVVKKQIGESDWGYMHLLMFMWACSCKDERDADAVVLWHMDVCCAS
jgi:hypothetical protein